MFDPERTGRFIRFLADTQKEIARMNAPLPPFKLVSRCPKCGMEGGTGPRLLDGVTGLWIDIPNKPFPVEYHAPYPLSYCSVEARGEHLCRKCPRCDFRWAEALPQFPDAAASVMPHIRLEVAAFALLMERELAKHDDRGGWQDCGKPWLVIQLREQVEKLATSLEDNPAYLGHRAADAANFCMFIADVGGALDPEKGDVS